MENNDITRYYHTGENSISTVEPIILRKILKMDLHKTENDPALFP